MLDTSRTFETPEGVDLGLSIAGPIVRAQAWLIDLLIRAAIYIGLGIILNFLGDFGGGIWLIIIFLTEWFYPVIFEIFKNGATPGKKRMCIKVINDNGTPIHWSASIVRNLLRVVDFMPFGYAFGLCSILISRDFKRLGDLAASTLVVYEEPTASAPEIPTAEPAVPRQALTLEEQRAILEFSERSSRLSPERCEELAELLEVITAKQGPTAVVQLHRYANWLQGRS